MSHISNAGSDAEEIAESTTPLPSRSNSPTTSAAASSAPDNRKGRGTAGAASQVGANLAPNRRGEGGRYSIKKRPITSAADAANDLWDDEGDDTLITSKSVMQEKWGPHVPRKASTQFKVSSVLAVEAVC
jgi:hypothetical protein